MNNKTVCDECGCEMDWDTDEVFLGAGDKGFICEDCFNEEELNENN